MLDMLGAWQTKMFAPATVPAAPAAPKAENTDCSRFRSRTDLTREDRDMLEMECLNKLREIENPSLKNVKLPRENFMPSHRAVAEYQRRIREADQRIRDLNVGTPSKEELARAAA